MNNWFRTFTTINGFQIFPGFCTGLGLSYNNYEFPAVYRGKSYYIISSAYPTTQAKVKNVSFLPVFLDVRTHLSSRRIAPFIKFDIGYNILLSKKSMTVYAEYYWGGIPQAYTFKVVGGGIYLSPGIGLRIAVTKLIQMITTVEYSYESLKNTLIYEASQYPSNKYGINFFKFNIGIGFQKKLK